MAVADAEPQRRSTPLRTAMSRCVGWLADRKVPGPLRAPLYRTYARFTGADLSEVRLDLRHHPSLGAFFVRELKDGARPVAAGEDALVSPVDGRIQDLSTVTEGTLLQAKGRSYEVGELLGGAPADVDLEGAQACTIYLSPRDYHRIHSPADVRLEEVRWIAGALYSVAPKVLARRRVLEINERVVLRLSDDAGPLFLVLVGATNVGRIRVVGVPPGEPPPSPPRAFAKGEELARFEMGSTIVLVVPRGRFALRADAAEGDAVRMGEQLGRLLPVPAEQAAP